MMHGWLFALTLVAALGCALVSGVFFAFSGFVMPAMARLPPAQAVAAMQSINVTAVRPPLMLAMFGTAALCLVLAVVAFTRLGRPGASWLLAGSVVYIVGTIVVTIAFNVPRNNALAAVAADSSAAAGLWPRYLTTWTAWNHVRTVAPLAAAAVLVYCLTQ